MPTPQLRNRAEYYRARPGSPLLNLATEFPDQNHPGWIIVRENKEELRARLATLVAKLGNHDPDRAASQGELCGAVSRRTLSRRASALLLASRIHRRGGPRCVRHGARSFFSPRAD
jgi:hypothetical protein